MNIAEAAAKWGVSTNTVMGYVEKGLINNLSASKNQLILPDIPKPYIQGKKADRYEQVYKYILKASNEDMYVDAYVLKTSEKTFKDCMVELIKGGMLRKSDEKAEPVSNLGYAITIQGIELLGKMNKRNIVLLFNNGDIKLGLIAV